MGFIIFMVIVFILMFCAAGCIGFALFLSGEKSKKKAEANAPEILDKAFVGEDVAFKINDASPKYETVVLGAKARRYRLANETRDTASGSSKTLIFEKI
ncbi:flagellar basal body-associated protein FliL [Arthrobacter sp. B2I5]|uniref:hypothetical protein n=1 Tax=Arthrobacter sp. B2I5 TaxID=3042266 RepID=UPI0027827333|nr:hypothetical protein [Arthrobacter sp. B2I5]MDQ0826259.1 flagellar basal body-associated protein FliL [Arthrobacter sp. B2I5]